MKIGLKGNSHKRRKQFRELQKKHGEDNVTRVDNPKAFCKRTMAEIKEKQS